MGRTEGPESPYEKLRRERMTRNSDVMKKLNIERTQAELRDTVYVQENLDVEAHLLGGRGGVQQENDSGLANRAAAIRQKKMSVQKRKRRPIVGRDGQTLDQAMKMKAAALVPTRKSSRIRGEKPDLGVGGSEGPSRSLEVAESPSAQLLTSAEFFEGQGLPLEPAFESDGKFYGWVEEETCLRYGIAGDPDTAWNKNGGGKFTFKIKKSDIPSHLRSRGWSDARAFSATQMKKNPNAYFYRHVAPHESQAQGEWTQEETALFLDTAQKFGVGDKWGLFSSYVPRRVGYQCSAYYRELIEEGRIVDPRFRLTRAGKAVFVGR